MVVDLCSEAYDTSPRISFSHDLVVSGTIPVEHAPLRSGSSGLNQSFDFDSCGFDHPGWSPADELFSDGKMIPLLHVKKKVQEGEGFSGAPLPKEDHHQHDGEDQEKEGTAKCDNKNKSFWRFGRSSSLNGDSSSSSSSRGGYSRMGLCPLPLLLRSNSTGSTTTQHASRHSAPRPVVHPRELNPGSNGWYQKPPLGRAGRSTVRVDPVLNVVATGNVLSGLYSVFGRDKRKRK
ncbi:hypothetical protein MLD38_013321 [Melastoma candidum]|uniref:Uncharacterized protein n=1 Tax=Melastoma candidum TaxID=119954 RepID=A0ACB9R9U1_9MYRT|nr:hypothetical protein MLD38_013321 [Melastoma candidum]